MLSCVFNPAACLGTAADSFIGLFPYGTLGVAFTAGLIIGSILGKWGVGALIALVIALKFGSQQQHEPVEHFERHPDHAQAPTPRPRPVRKPHRTLSDLFKGLGK